MHAKTGRRRWGVAAATAAAALLTVLSPAPAHAHQINVTGSVACYSTATPTWVWMYKSYSNGVAVSDHEGWWAQLSNQRPGKASYAKGFSRVPWSGHYITAKWGCNRYSGEHWSTFYMYDRSKTVHLCPWSPCYG